MHKQAMIFIFLASLIAPIRAFADGNAEKGKAVFGEWCSGCHSPLAKTTVGAQGIAQPILQPPAGTYVLQQRYKDKIPAALEERTDLTAAQIKTRVRTGGGIMPPTRKTEVSDEQLEDLVAYLTRNNKTSAPAAPSR